MTTFKKADDDLGQSRQPALSPIFKRVAPTLVRHFQKAMKSVPPATRKRALNTYFKGVKLSGDPSSSKNTKILRDILVKALIRDRGWLEFVAEQILDGSPELADILAPAKTASVVTAQLRIASGNYPNDQDLQSVAYPVTFPVLGQSDAWYRLETVARDYGCCDGTTITLDNAEEAAGLFRDLLAEAEDYEKDCENQLYQDYTTQAEEGVTEEEWLDENYHEYCADIHDPAAILAGKLGL